jgi:hypothetical protein
MTPTFGFEVNRFSALHAVAKFGNELRKLQLVLLGG